MLFKKRKTKHSGARFENLTSQPRREHAVFNNVKILPQAWYPVCPSREVKINQAQSFVIGHQRLVVFRAASGEVKALDAFCPHMGADLGNGQVAGENIQCYFHRWEYSGDGKLQKIPCRAKLPSDVKIPAYPTEEKFGFIWVYSAAGVAPYSVPHPAGLEGKSVKSFYLGSTELYVHHHIMMLGGIDLQHFATVHDLDIKFRYEVKEQTPGIFDWSLDGEFPVKSLKTKILSFFLGTKIGYLARMAGGSIVSITYGPDQRWQGKGAKLSPLYLYWGCVPQKTGLSRVHIFTMTEKRMGRLGFLKETFAFFLTGLLLLVLRDDDVKAVPNMRFTRGAFIDTDESAAQFIRMIDTLPPSTWSSDGHP